MLSRTILQHISDWFRSNTGRPLILTGTRQTGKTEVIREFGKSVPQFVELGMRFMGDRFFFEENFSGEDFWKDLISFKKADLGLRTLLFIDDIAESPNALKWIREVRPPEGWSVIGASANELKDLSSLRLFPFSFLEFLMAMEEKEMAASYEEVPYPPHDFSKLKGLYHLYALIGGMPEVVTQYSRTRELADLAPVYEKIQDIFEDEIDNSTVSRKIRERAREMLQNAFPFATERISFRNFASTGSGSRETARILQMLQEMMLLELVYPVSDKRENISKRPAPRLHLPDTGLINYFTAIQKQVFETSDLMALFNGQIIRHITGQEIAASGQPVSFWTRSKPQSEAIVDYLIRFEDKMIPVVIKKGEPGRLRSLFQYMDHCSHPFAVRIWDEPVAVRQVQTMKGKKFYLLNLPYFMSGKLKEYLHGLIRLSEI